MNERISDLMNQAMPVIDWKARYGVELNNGERMKWYAEWFDNFAKLIVKDCMEHAVDFNHQNLHLSDKVLRSNICRVGDYIESRMLGD